MHLPPLRRQRRDLPRPWRRASTSPCARGHGSGARWPSCAAPWRSPRTRSATSRASSPAAWTTLRPPTGDADPAEHEASASGVWRDDGPARRRPRPPSARPREDQAAQPAGARRRRPGYVWLPRALGAAGRGRPDRVARADRRLAPAPVPPGRGRARSPGPPSCCCRAWAGGRSPSRWRCCASRSTSPGAAAVIAIALLLPLVLSPAAADDMAAQRRRARARLHRPGGRMARAGRTRRHAMAPGCAGRDRLDLAAFGLGGCREGSLSAAGARCGTPTCLDELPVHHRRPSAAPGGLGRGAGARAGVGARPRSRCRGWSAAGRSSSTWSASSSGPRSWCPPPGRRSPPCTGRVGAGRGLGPHCAGRSGSLGRRRAGCRRCSGCGAWRCAQVALRREFRSMDPPGGAT